MLPILCFGQEDVSALDTGESLLNRIATNLGTEMRQWWVPDANFLSGLLREQVVAVAKECGASDQMPGFNGWTKKQLVGELVRFFADRSSPETLEADEDRRAAEWLPGMLRFPATKTVVAEPPAA
jgi:ParB family chromosome partitioning protein